MKSATGMLAGIAALKTIMEADNYAEKAVSAIENHPSRSQLKKLLVMAYMKGAESMLDTLNENIKSK